MIRGQVLKNSKHLKTRLHVLAVVITQMWTPGPSQIHREACFHGDSKCHEASQSWSYHSCLFNLITGVMNGPRDELASAVTGVSPSFTAATAAFLKVQTCSWELVQFRFHVCTTQYFLLN